ncbi:ATP-dependent dethiobiotin synthetase BioD [Euzebya rosea]|uniref:ATP-dependent dethiobiotin synthetase BioD n=1 Tax=Euzebya rosea TaxID=2052804 RepID=UPI000D3E524D|nr:ATP-dependent dethiobiotin synthetase BioD [Euzebya rosea]
MTSGVLVTGTDDGVDTAIVSAALVASRPGAVHVRPVRTGSADHDAVVAALTGHDTVWGTTLEVALPPGPAARHAGVRLERPHLLAPFRGVELAVGEGAGGLLVELGTDGTTLADLATDLELPLVLATRAVPSAINHTRLTLEASWARGLRVLGLVVTGYPSDPDLSAATTMAELERMAPVMATVPLLDRPLVAADLPRIEW